MSEYDWYPQAERLPFRYNSTTRTYADGGSMLGGSSRGVLHTTEAFAYTPSRTSYYGHANPPHLTLDPNRGQFFQHFPLVRAARALRNQSGGVQTNRQGKINIQIELVWKAGKIKEFPALDLLRDFMLWAKQTYYIPFETSRAFVGSESWGANSASRMSSGEWVAYTGWCGHQHVPENSHWDPGRLDVNKLFTAPTPISSDAYIDEADWPKWAAGSIQKAIDKGVIVGGVVNGRKVWNPEGVVTRAQMAVVLDRLNMLEE